MSVEKANKSRFERGLMCLTELEGELLASLEYVYEYPDCLAIENKSGQMNLAIIRIRKAYGHD